MRGLKATFFILAASTAFTAVDMIRIVEVDPTPEPNNVSVKIVYPLKGGVDREDPADIEVKLEGFPVGTMTGYFERSRELRQDDQGQSLHVIIDNDHYFTVHEATVDAYNEDEDYFVSVLNFTIPYRLDEGIHTVRVFPSRPYGESLKGENCFEASYFYFKKKEGRLKVNLNDPYITYNEPQGKFKMKGRNKPILLDFYVNNCELSSDGFKVKVIIDKTTERVLTKWVPYYIYGLKRGEHTIQLELLDSANKLVSGPFNATTRKIYIE